MSTTPPPYDRQATFTNFSTEPAPTVGQDLEAEFNKIKQSQDATQSRLAEIQRDDGKLANLSVHPDALSNAVRALLSIDGEIRGLWQTGLVYNIGDVIEGPDGITYLCTVQHVANASFTVDVNAGRWIVIDSGIAYDALIRADLASTASGKGAAMVKVKQQGASAVDRTLQDIVRDRVNVKGQGAKGNGIAITGAVTINSGAAALTVAGAAFASTDVGKAIAVPGAGAAGGTLYALINAWTSPTQVTLSANAGTTLAASTQRVVYGSDDTAAFQSAIDALPTYGGTIEVPEAIYMIHASAPNSGTKSIQWNISAGAVFDGALGGSTSLLAFPRAATNESIVPFGTYSQVRSSTLPSGVNTLAAASGLFEALQPSSFGGNSVGIYAGARSGSANGYLWAANILAQADLGFGKTMHGIELDVNVFTTDAAALIKGLGISGIGTALGSGGRKADVGIEIQHGVGWKRGIDILNSDIGLQIRNSCATGIAVNAPAAGTGAVLTGKQLANGNEMIWLQRAADAGVSGYFLRFRNAANSDDIMTVDAANGSIATDGTVTSAGFTTTGTTDTFNAMLRFAAPAGAAGIVGLGNGTAVTVGAAGGAAALPATPLVYWSVTVNGVAVKIPCYNA